MKNIYIIFMLIGPFMIAQETIDTNNLSKEEYSKQDNEIYNKAIKDTKEKGLNESGFGTNSSSYNFKGYNYEFYANGKYSEVAKAEDWSKWALPDNMDQRLESYENQLLTRNIAIGISALIILFIGLIWTRKSSETKDV